MGGMGLWKNEVDDGKGEEEVNENKKKWKERRMGKLVRWMRVRGRGRRDVRWMDETVEDFGRACVEGRVSGVGRRVSGVFGRARRGAELRVLVSLNVTWLSVTGEC